METKIKKQFSGGFRTDVIKKLSKRGFFSKKPLSSELYNTLLLRTPQQPPPLPRTRRAAAPPVAAAAVPPVAAPLPPLPHRTRRSAVPPVAEPLPPLPPRTSRAAAPPLAEPLPQLPPRTRRVAAVPPVAVPQRPPPSIPQSPLLPIPVAELLPPIPPSPEQSPVAVPPAIPLPEPLPPPAVAVRQVPVRLPTINENNEGNNNNHQPAVAARQVPVRLPTINENNEGNNNNHQPAAPEPPAPQQLPIIRIFDNNNNPQPPAPQQPAAEPPAANLAAVPQPAVPEQPVANPILEPEQQRISRRNRFIEYLDKNNPNQEELGFLEEYIKNNFEEIDWEHLKKLFNNILIFNIMISNTFKTLLLQFLELLLDPKYKTVFDKLNNEKSLLDNNNRKLLQNILKIIDREPRALPNNNKTPDFKGLFGNESGVPNATDTARGLQRNSTNSSNKNKFNYLFLGKETATQLEHILTPEVIDSGYFTAQKLRLLSNLKNMPTKLKKIIEAKIEQLTRMGRTHKRGTSHLRRNGKVSHRPKHPYTYVNLPGVDSGNSSSNPTPLTPLSNKSLIANGTAPQPPLQPAANLAAEPPAPPAAQPLALENPAPQAIGNGPIPQKSNGTQDKLNNIVIKNMRTLPSNSNPSNSNPNNYNFDVMRPMKNDSNGGMSMSLKAIKKLVERNLSKFTLDELKKLLTHFTNNLDLSAMIKKRITEQTHKKRTPQSQQESFLNHNNRQFRDKYKYYSKDQLKQELKETDKSFSLKELKVLVNLRNLQPLPELKARIKELIWNIEHGKNTEQKVRIYPDIAQVFPLEPLKVGTTSNTGTPNYMNMQNNNSLTKPQAQQSQQSQQQPSSASPASITLANTEPLVSSASSAARTQRVGKRERRKLYATEETHKNTGINSKNTNDVILTKWREKQVIFNNKDNYKKFINRNLLKFTKDELKGFYEEFETLPEFSKKIVKRLQDLNSGASILTTNPEVNEYLNNNVSLLTLTRGNILQIPENSLLYSILNDKFNTLTERQKKELLTEKKINRLRVDIESLNKKQLNKVLLVIDSIDPTIKQIILDKLAYLKQREKAARQQAQEAPNPAGRQLKPALQELNTESTTNSLSKINYQEMFAEFHKPPKPSNVVIQEQIANLPNHPAPGAGKNNSTALVVKGINNATSAIEALKMKEQTEKAAIIIKRLKRLEQFMRQRPELVQNFISEGISTFNRNELQYVLSYTNSKEILGDKIYKMVARTLAEKIQEENQNTSPTVRQFSQERTQEVPLSSLLTSSKNPVPNSNDFEEYQIREQAQASNERSPYNPTAFRNAASTGVGFDSVQNPGGVSASNGMRHNNNNLNISGINFTKLNSLNNKTLKKLVLEKNLQKLTSRQLKRLRRYKKIQYSIREGIIAGYQQRASFLQAQSRRNPKAAGLELKKKTGSSTA